jgi:uncharacterized protein DUF4262
MCWLCDNPGATLDEYDDHIHRLVEEYGWAVQGVEGDGVHPPWAYTVGLTAAGLPELVVTGLDPEPAAELLNDAARHIRLNGGRVPDRYLQLPGSGVAGIVTVAVPDAHLEVAVALYGSKIRALQLVLPDTAGRWPWDESYQGTPGGQPVLGARWPAGS